MTNKRVIPVLTIDDGKLVKTVRFKNPNYIGDPVNAVKIFNDKEVDEIVLLDITASKLGREPNYLKIEEICSEAFMPFAYGGGISSIEQVDRLFKIGIEKIILNSVFEINLDLISEISSKYGAQSVIASIDVKKDLFRKYKIYTKSGSDKLKFSIEEFIVLLEEKGVGEIMLNSIDNEGTYKGYDLAMLKLAGKHSTVPIILCGGANSISNMKAAIDNGASAVAASSLFVYRGNKNGILINYPSQEELKSLLF